MRSKKPRCFWFDIDGTLTTTNGKEYGFAKPNKSMIRVVNHLYNKGHRIVLFTGRGGSHGIDYRGLTKQQLSSWGVQYHTLITGLSKDLVVDDKCVRPGEIAW